MVIPFQSNDAFENILEDVGRYSDEEAVKDETEIKKYKKVLSYIDDLKEQNLCDYEASFEEIPYFIHHIYIQWNYDTDIELSTKDISKLFHNMNTSIIIQENGDWFITTKLYKERYE